MGLGDTDSWKKPELEISCQTSFNIDSLHLPSLFKPRLCPATRDCIQRETWCLGPCAGVYYYLTLCRLHKVHINLEYHSVCPLVRVGTHPLPLILASVPPLGTKGDSRAHLPAGVEKSEFQRLEKNFSTLVYSVVDSNTCTMGQPMPELTLSWPYVRVDFIPSQGLRIWPQFRSLAFEIQCVKVFAKKFQNMLFPRYELF